jgi:DNA primase RepB-like protein
MLTPALRIADDSADFQDFTNCKPKYKRLDGLFPFVRFKSYSGEQYPIDEAFAQEITKLYEERNENRSGQAEPPQASEEVHGLTVKHRIAEIHAIRIKRLSKLEAAEDPSDGTEDE